MDAEDFAIETASSHQAASRRRGGWKRYPFPGRQRFEMEKDQPSSCRRLVDLIG